MGHCSPEFSRGFFDDGAKALAQGLGIRLSQIQAVVKLQ